MNNNHFYKSSNLILSIWDYFVGVHMMIIMVPVTSQTGSYFKFFAVIL